MSTLDILPPGGHPLSFVVWLNPGGRQSATSIARQATEAADGRPVVVVSDFANPALRAACTAAGVGFIDLTGWVNLRDDSRGFYVSHEGDAKSPSAGSTGRRGPMKRLDGPGASRVIRALWDTPLPRGVRSLASSAGTSAGTVSKVLAALTQHGAIERSEAGEVTAVDRRLLIDRWTQDYGVFTLNPEVLWRLSPRGTDYAYSDLLRTFLDRGKDMGAASVTGYMGAVTSLSSSVIPVIPHDLLAVYCADPEVLSEALRLRPADPSRANVVLIRPKDPQLIPQHPGGPWPHSVPDAQVVADLMTMGGRHPELAEQLLAEAPPHDEDSDDDTP